MSLIKMTLDESFHQNKPCAITLKVRMNPWVHRGTAQYHEAQELMAEFRNRLVTLIEDSHD